MHALSVWLRPLFARLDTWSYAEVCTLFAAVVLALVIVRRWREAFAQRPVVICAWCQQRMRRGNPALRPSHGCCTRCMAIWLGGVAPDEEPARSPRGLWRSSTRRGPVTRGIGWLTDWARQLSAKYQPR